MNLGKDPHELLSLTPEIFTPTRISTNYDPDAICPKFEILLEKILTKDQIFILQEWFGYCILKWLMPERFLLIVDPKDIIVPMSNILSYMIGEDCIHLHLRDIRYGKIKFIDSTDHIQYDEHIKTTSYFQV